MFKLAQAYIAGAAMALPVGVGLGINLVSSEDIRGIELSDVYEHFIESSTVDEKLACGLIALSVSNINEYFAAAVSLDQTMQQISLSYNNCPDLIEVTNFNPATPSQSIFGNIR